MSLPAQLVTIVAEFQAAPKALRVPLLLDYAKKLPPLPEDVAGDLEQVHECQTPLFVLARLGPDDTVSLFFDAPPEAPTTRGFAAIVRAGLAGAKASEVLALPEDFYSEMGLAELISPLRLRGMGAIVRRVKRQVGRLLESNGGA